MHYKYKHSHFFDDVPRTNFKELSGNICIYGAGFQGLLAAFLLKKQNVDVLCFCDQDVKKQETVYYNLPVYSPKKMKELYPDATVIVTPYSLAPAYQYVKEKLGYKNTVTPYSLFLEFNSDDFDALPEIPDWYHTSSLCYQIDLFMRICINVITSYKLLAVDISVTEKCNLRCRDCTSLMPCYVKPKHFALSKVISDFEVLSQGRIIYNVNIEGGEALTWPYLSEFIDYLCLKENVLTVYLVTNGTIIPDNNILNSLKNEKVIVRVSDYGKYSKIEELNSTLGNNNINYNFFLPKWYELSSFSKKPKSGKAYYDVINSCCKVQPFGNGTNYLMNGKLFKCPIQANMHNLGLFISSEADYIDLRSSDTDLYKKIDDFVLTKKIPELCKYCYGRTFVGHEVPPAVQLKKGESIEVKFV